MESVAVVADQYTSLVKKGRRTKRQRSFAGAITSLSSTGGDGSDGTADGGGGSNFENNLYSSSSTASASGHCNSDDQDIMSEITTEEEDMAYCLIMLARGTTFTTATATATATASATTTGIDKLPAVATKYECKTCNKTFHSFQALGGHRASHKKPKLTSPENQSTKPNPNPNPNPSPSLSPSPSLDHNQQVKTNEGPTNKMAALRVHECSICGSEFPSGQALGGHMRRHRTTPLAAVPVGRPIESGPRNVVLPLDLNLPAPGDDDDVKIEAADSLGQSIETTTFHRVLPTPPLVDCHY